MMNIFSILNTLSPLISFLIVIFSFIMFVAVMNFLFYKKRVRFLKITVPIFCILILSSFVHKNLLMAKIEMYIENITNVNVFWNGVPVEDELLMAKKIANLSKLKLRSGSEPLHRNILTFDAGDEKVTFLVMQDSKEPELYWVYYPAVDYLPKLGFIKLQTQPN